MENNRQNDVMSEQTGYSYISGENENGGVHAYTIETKTKRKRTVPLPMFIICVILALIIGGAAAGTASILNGIKDTKPQAGTDIIDQNKINSLKRQIDKYYKGEYDDKDLVEGAYHGYVDGIGDEYSTYMTKEEYQEDLESFSGEYSGIGITFNEDEDGNYKVSDVNEDSPAKKAGIKPGDYILTVDGETYDTMDQMAKHMRGKDGTRVTIEYMHQGRKIEAELTRAKIHQQSVKHEMLDDSTGLIEINSFIETTGDDFHKALKDVESKGAKYLILDLRNNGGGLVDECVKVADEFLDKGVVCYVEDKNGDTETYDAKDGKTGLKTVVLVNENSASASEILSYAMKDNDFTIIGNKTFGKGVIQVTLPQSDGSALELTVMEYLSPDKHKVHKQGVPPDVEVDEDQDTEEDEQLDKAREVVKQVK